MQALVLVLANVFSAEDGFESEAVIGHHSATVYQAHAIGRRLGRHRVLDATAQLADGGARGHVSERDAAL